jgi:hypothetical protein
MQSFQRFFSGKILGKNEAPKCYTIGQRKIEEFCFFPISPKTLVLIKRDK